MDRRTLIAALTGLCALGGVLATTGADAADDPAPTRAALRPTAPSTTASSTTASSGAAAEEALGPNQFRLFEPYGPFRVTDRGRDGDAGPLDHYVFHDTLARGGVEGERVGAVDGACTIALTGINVCTITFTLTGRGTITTAGAQTDYPNTMAIVGGTGEFRTARGQVTSRNTGGDFDVDVFTVLTP